MLRILALLSIAAVLAVPHSSAYARPKGGGDGFIVVNADGSKARGSAGLTSVLYRAPGEYRS